MATITLTANTNVSALTLANDDTIDLAGFVLTFDVQPTVTGIQVTTPGTNGTCVFPVACVIPTWDFFAGAVELIATLPENCEIGSITAGSAANARGVGSNFGKISIVNGGSASTAVGVNTNATVGNIGAVNAGTAGGAHGMATNNGTVNTATGGSAGNTFGITTNTGTVFQANGGSASNTPGVAINNATVGLAIGGSVGFGVGTNNSTVGKAIGGTGLVVYGINTNDGVCLRGEDGVGRAINLFRGDFKLVIGPEFQTTIENPRGDITTIYSIGPLSELATIPAGVQVITLSEGIGTAGFTGIRALSRRLGT